MPEAYQLSDFSSLIEVAVGLNLVFSLWEELRHSALSRFEGISENLNTKLKAQFGDKFENSRCATEFESMKSRYSKTLIKFSSFSKWSGIFCAASMVILLIVIGFSPKITITINPLYALVFFAVLLTPTFLIIGNLYVYYCSSRLESFSNSQGMAIEDVLKLYSNK